MSLMPAPSSCHDHVHFHDRSPLALFDGTGFEEQWQLALDRLDEAGIETPRLRCEVLQIDTQGQPSRVRVTSCATGAARDYDVSAPVWATLLEWDADGGVFDLMA